MVIPLFIHNSRFTMSDFILISIFCLYSLTPFPNIKNIPLRIRDLPKYPRKFFRPCQDRLIPISRIPFCRAIFPPDLVDRIKFSTFCQRFIYPFIPYYLSKYCGKGGSDLGFPRSDTPSLRHTSLSEDYKQWPKYLHGALFVSS